MSNHSLDSRAGPWPSTLYAPEIREGIERQNATPFRPPESSLSLELR